MIRCLMVAWLLFAWVLWSESTASAILAGKFVDPPGRYTWAIQEATDTRAQCEGRREALMREVLSAQPLPGFKRTRVRGLASRETIHEEGINAAGAKLSYRTGYVCLPAGTDPRPRGKE